MYIDKYYEMINKIDNEEGENVAKIVVSLNEKLIRTKGLYAPRFFTGIVDITVKFDEDYCPTVLKYEFDDQGEFYEHDYITDFVYNNIDPSNEDMKRLEQYAEEKLMEVVYGTNDKRIA